MIKIAITSRSFGKINSGAVELLKKCGLHPILTPYDKKLTEDQIIEILDNSVGIIAGTENITRKVIESNQNLSVISRYGIGMDNVDLVAAEENDVVVYNTPETPSLAVAELTIALIFLLLKKICKLDSKLKKNCWNPEIGNMLSGKTVGIVGLGRIGKKVTSFLKPFNVKIIAFDVAPEKVFVKENNIEIVPFKELLEKSDIITIHVPYTEETKNLIDKNSLEKMKETALLINTARGGIINEDDLYNALKDNIIAGAAIDVFKHEPDVGKLKKLDNIILTPHIATYTVETRKEMELEATKNLIHGLKEKNII